MGSSVGWMSSIWHVLLLPLFRHGFGEGKIDIWAAIGCGYLPVCRLPGPLYFTPHWSKVLLEAGSAAIAPGNSEHVADAHGLGGKGTERRRAVAEPTPEVSKAAVSSL